MHTHYRSERWPTRRRRSLRSSHAIWLVPACPIAAFVLLIAFGRRLGEPVAGWLAVVGMLGAFVAAVCTWVGLRSMDGNQRSYTQHLFTWIGAGRFHVDIAFLVDPLSVTMCLFVTFVGLRDLHLFDRLHEGRPGLLQVLHLPVVLRRLDARSW